MKMTVKAWNVCYDIVPVHPSLEGIRQQSDSSLIYQLKKPLANGQTQLKLTSLELNDKLAALVPPPRIHRHRYYGELAPNSPFRASVTAMAGMFLAHGSIEMQNSNHKDDEEPIEQEQENKPKRPPNRYAIIDRKVLAELFCLQHVVKLQETHAQWMRESLRSDTLQRDDFWSKSLAVSHPSFLKKVKSCLGIKSRYREIEEQQDVHVLREPTISYTTHFRQE